MVAYFLLDKNWHFFAFLCSTDTPSIRYHGLLLGPGPLFGTREYLLVHIVQVLVMRKQSKPSLHLLWPRISTTKNPAGDTLFSGLAENITGILVH